jgi:hypothetical protein
VLLPVCLSLSPIMPCDVMSLCHSLCLVLLSVSCLPLCLVLLCLSDIHYQLTLRLLLPHILLRYVAEHTKQDEQSLLSSIMSCVSCVLCLYVIHYVLCCCVSLSSMTPCVAKSLCHSLRTYCVVMSICHP